MKRELQIALNALTIKTKKDYILLSTYLTFDGTTRYNLLENVTLNNIISGRTYKDMLDYLMEHAQ